MRNLRIGSLLTVAVVIGALGNEGPAAASSACQVPSQKPSIQAAVNDHSCSTILVAPGIYSAHVTVGRAVVIRGAGSDRTVVDGSQTSRVFDTTSPGVSIVGMTIRHGQAPNGAGIYNTGVLTLRDVKVSANVAPGISSLGGGVYNTGTLTLESSRVISNSSAFGGGVANTGSLTVQDSSLSWNRAKGPSGIGGGLYNTGSGVVLRVAVYGNTARYLGGGVANASGTAGTLHLDNMTFWANTAEDGGGLFADPGRVVMRNDTLALNHLTGTSVSGGGIAANGRVEIKNTILSHNDVANCDVYPNPGAQIVSRGHNLDAADSCVFRSSGDLHGQNALLGPFRENGGPSSTMAISSGSPAHDTGLGCMSTDQRGMPRPQGAGCDRGAYELATCRGLTVDQVGTARRDVMVGTNDVDSFMGLGGNDIIKGLGNIDALCGGAGNDSLYGGPGADRFDGGAGHDLCDGGAGHDSVRLCEQVRSIP